MWAPYSSQVGDLDRFPVKVPDGPPVEVLGWLPVMVLERPLVLLLDRSQEEGPSEDPLEGLGREEEPQQQGP